MTITVSLRERGSRRDVLRRAGATAVGVGMLPILHACGGEQGAGQPTAPAPPAAVTPTPTGVAASQAGEQVIEMNDQLRFVPDKLTIKIGETVTWTTTGAQPHTSTADPAKAQDPGHVKLPEGAEPWDSGVISTGQSWSRTFDVPGEYAYFCIPHEATAMLGTLSVTA